MTTYYNSTTAPLVKQLNAIFRVIPDKDLLNELKARTGRPGYTVKVLWRTYIAMVVLGIPTFSGLIRTLQNNPLIAVPCGITSYDGVPSKYAYSRFVGKLAYPRYRVMVKNIMRQLTRELYTKLPNFGRSVAIDSTDIKAWANGNRKPPADPHASWGAKTDTNGKKRFYYGYKLHVLADTQYEIPIAANVTNASVHDVAVAEAVLSNARYTYSKFHPQYIICDAGYSSNRLRRIIRWQYKAEPIIKVNPTHKRAVFVESKEWKAIFRRRSAIERLFSRLKCHRRLNNVTIRRKGKVTVHCFLSLIVVQAQALHSAMSNQVSFLRQCVYVQ